MLPRLFMGWRPDPQAVQAVIDDPTTPVHEIGREESADLEVGRPPKSKAPIILFDAVKPLFPDWSRGSQGIGDCVSWGWELVIFLTVCCGIKLGEAVELAAEFATESIYGGSRVEANGGRLGGYSDGSIGAWAAKFVTEAGGALLRIDYSKTTGIDEHDLRRYSADKAKAWGNFGNGGKNDKGKLDALAQEVPVKKAYRVTTWDQYVAAIESGYAVAICSDQGLGERDRYGFAPPKGTWYHCMGGTGVRYDRPGGLITNSWGNSWGTNAPFYVDVETNNALDYWPAVIKCSAWVEKNVIERMLRQGDSFAVTGVDGLKRREIDWNEGWEIHGRT